MKLALNLTTKVWHRLRELAERTGELNMTGLVRKALHLYEIVAEADARGEMIILVKPEALLEQSGLSFTQVTIAKGASDGER